MKRVIEVWLVALAMAILMMLVERQLSIKEKVNLVITVMLLVTFAIIVGCLLGGV